MQDKSQMAERFKLLVAVHLFLVRDGEVLLRRRYSSIVWGGRHRGK
jgi:hypothetical protein